MNTEQTFGEWVKQQSPIEWNIPLMGKITYNDIDCLIKITNEVNTSTGESKTIRAEIRPMRPIYDIGNGCGMSVFKTFK